MRYLVLLQKIETPISPETKDDGTPCHIHDKNIRDKVRSLTVLYETNEMFRTNYKKIVKFTHPFDTITSNIKSTFIPNCPLLKITNAFMKQYEFLEYIDKYLPTEGTLRMFDVAGAPGMFVFATEYYLAHSSTKNKLTLDWHACSLTDDADALTDLYRLYEHNPNRFQPCNVLKEEDIKKCLTKGKFDLITGDIGSVHGFDKLQEETHLDLQWGQMVLALNLSHKGSIMFLKMYTFITEESHYLLDILTQYFEYVYLSKPYTSRLLNDESYIICLNRNEKDCSKLPLTRPKISHYLSPNEQIITTFESTRSDYKIQISSLLTRILEQYPNITFKALIQNYQYKIYYNQIARLNYLFYNINKGGGEGADGGKNININSEEIKKMLKLMN